MTVREFERRAAQRRQSEPVRDREIGLDQFRILSFAQWCALNASARRLAAAS
jgi:hypothetical protein